MNLNKISNFIKEKRKELGLTQEELATKLFVTEKAVSRWETGRGTPDISLLIPLAKELKVDVSELLSGEENIKVEYENLKVIEYYEFTKSKKYNFYFWIILFFYILSILSFLFYLRFEYDPSIELNYFIRLFFTIIASFFLIIANRIYENQYVEKLENKKKVKIFSQSILFVYYLIFLFNMVLFARYRVIQSYNIIPFQSILESIQKRSFYSISISLLGNFFIFMPLAYFMLELFKVKKFSFYLFSSIFIIFIIELFQYIFHLGVFDIDDLILRILGMIIFYFGYTKLKKK